VASPPVASDPVAAIRQCRDDALTVLQAAIDQVERQIAATTERGPFLTRLLERDRALIDEANAIDSAATDAVLALPELIQAAGTLSSLAKKMTTVAQNLPQVTKLLDTTASILTLGQQFADTVAKASNKSSAASKTG
jgi:hypothetical protein